MQKNSILNLIKLSATNEEAYKALESIFRLYEQLQYASNLNQVATDIFNWLEKEFDVKDASFSLFDINQNSKTTILSKGGEFYFDDDLSHFFIINTHTNLNATVSFCASNEEHSLLIENSYETIEAGFFIISTIVQNAIIKKNFIDSSSLDSVTNVLTRHYFIENLSSYLKLSKKNQEEIFLLMIGIDRFKAIIDEFNYDISDKVLIELARIIYSNINEFDLVGRLESNIFIVAILDQDEIQASEIARKIINDFANLEIVVDEQTGQILKKTACIGFEKFDLKSGQNLHDAIKNADIALSEARNKGRGEFFKYSKLKAEDTCFLF